MASSCWNDKGSGVRKALMVPLFCSRRSMGRDGICECRSGEPKVDDDERSKA